MGTVVQRGAAWISDNKKPALGAGFVLLDVLLA